MPEKSLHAPLKGTRWVRGEAAPVSRKARARHSQALVIGACGHGLAIVHALAHAGIPVTLMEANRSLPGARTRYARMLWVDNIQTDGLINTLLQLRHHFNGADPPILFPTNDRMVRVLAANWPSLEGRYRLSWSRSRATLAPLLDKDRIEARCLETGLNYPVSHVLNASSGIDEAVRSIGFPMIVKPVRPLSSFKTSLPATVQELEALCLKRENDLPFLVQQYIDGSDEQNLLFSALLLQDGEILARFDGRKLAARPLGHTTVAEPHLDDEVFDSARRFFSGLSVSGCVSLEVKRDTRGRLWVIEPTIGRSDYWLGLCTANGVNFPALEYDLVCGQSISAPSQTNEALWFNEQRQPFGILQHWPEKGHRRAEFLFLNARDLQPAIAFLAQTLLEVLNSVWRRLRT